MGVLPSDIDVLQYHTVCVLWCAVLYEIGKALPALADVDLSNCFDLIGNGVGALTVCCLSKFGQLYISLSTFDYESFLPSPRGVGCQAAEAA